MSTVISNRMREAIIDTFYKKYSISEDQQKILDQWNFLRSIDRRGVLISMATRAVAEMFMLYCPRSKELNSALINLEHAMINANLAIIEHDPANCHNYTGQIVKDYT